MTAHLLDTAGVFATITVPLDPILVRIGHFGLGWYGIAVGAAIAVALLVARREAKRRNIDPDVVLWVAGWSLAGGFVGARALFVVDHWSTYASDPIRSLAIREGGLAIQGALLGGLIAGVLAARRRRLPVLVLADMAAPAVVLGQAIGRLGCLFTGDALGGPTSLPWGVSYTNAASMAPQLGVSLHPVFAYEAIWDLALFALLWMVRTRGWQPGRLFATYLGLYAAGKFGLSFFRQERVWAWGLQEAQFVAAVLLIGALALWALTAFRGTRPAPAAAGAGSAAI
jgi:phosphatidylglycerol:prolipoprotein diacylglycerol transferase